MRSSFLYIFIHFEGASSHLTDFASDTKVEEPLTNLPNPDQIGGLLSKCCADAWHIIAVLGGLTMFNFFGIYYGLKSDERDFDMYKAFMRVDYLKKGT